MWYAGMIAIAAAVVVGEQNRKEFREREVVVVGEIEKDRIGIRESQHVSQIEVDCRFENASKQKCRGKNAGEQKSRQKMQKVRDKKIER